MPFFDRPHIENQVNTLISRMIALHQALEEGTITPEELTIISELSIQDLEDKSESLRSGKLDISGSPNDALKKFYEILKEIPEVAISDAGPLIDGLKRFDSEHGEYLPLAPLTTSN